MNYGTLQFFKTYFVKVPKLKLLIFLLNFLILEHIKYLILITCCNPIEKIVTINNYIIHIYYTLIYCKC